MPDHAESKRGGRFAAQRGQAPSPQRAEQVKSGRGGLEADLASGCTRFPCGSEPAREGGEPADELIADVPKPCGSLACQR